MFIPVWLLCALVAFLLVWRAHRKDVRVSDAAHWDGPDDPALTAWVQALDRAESRTRLLAPWRAPWPWWFLGACLSLAVLELIAGLLSWPGPDAPVLLVGGMLFLCAFALKAWAQLPAAPEPPPVRPGRR